LFLSNSTLWRDERADNRASQEELQVCWEAPRAVPASAAMEELAAAGHRNGACSRSGAELAPAPSVAGSTPQRTPRKTRPRSRKRFTTETVHQVWALSISKTDRPGSRFLPGHTAHFTCSQTHPGKKLTPQVGSPFASSSSPRARRALVVCGLRAGPRVQGQ